LYTLIFNFDFGLPICRSFSRKILIIYRDNQEPDPCYVCRTLEDNISASCDWIYAILDLLESPCLGLYVYQFLDKLDRRLPRYCAPKMVYILAFYMRMTFIFDYPFLCKQVVKVPSRLTHGLPLSCNRSWGIG
jgi:hypothetical protein